MRLIAISFLLVTAGCFGPDWSTTQVWLSPDGCCRILIVESGYSSDEVSVNIVLENGARRVEIHDKQYPTRQFQLEVFFNNRDRQVAIFGAGGLRVAANSDSGQLLPFSTLKTQMDRHLARVYRMPAGKSGIQGLAALSTHAAAESFYPFLKREERMRGEDGVVEESVARDLWARVLTER